MAIVFAALFAVASLSCVATGWHSWLARRGNQAAVALAATLVGCATWSAANVFTTVGLPAAVQIWAVKSSYVGVYVTSIGLFLLCQSIVEPLYRPSRAVGAILAIFPLAMLTAIFVLPVPGIFFRSIRLVGSPSHADIVLGPLFYVHTGFCYLVLGSAFWVIIRARRDAAPVVRRQLTCVIGGAAVPVVGNLLGILVPNTYGHRDLTPLFFSATGLMTTWALRQGLLRIIPVARALVLESIADSVFVLDARGRIVDVNPAARQLARQLHPEQHDEVVGESASDVIGPLADVDGNSSDARGIELLPGRFVNLGTTVINDIRGRTLGRVVVCHDVTELIRARTEVERQLDLVEQLRGELLEQTLRDPMTGAYNRRYLTEALTSALSAANRSGDSVAVLMLDIDHFKTINDRYGHQTGDNALIALVRTLAGNVRGFDIVARYGGEEFVIVLPGVARAEAMARAEELRVACAAIPIELPATAASATERAYVHVTVSIGCAVHPADATDADVLIALADHALYVAKADGRDRVVYASRDDLDIVASAGR